MRLKELLGENVGEMLDSTISKSPKSMVALYNNTDFMVAVKSFAKDVQYFEIALENFKKTKEFRKLNDTEQKDAENYAHSIIDGLSEILSGIEKFNNIMEN